MIRLSSQDNSAVHSKACFQSRLWPNPSSTPVSASASTTAASGRRKPDESASDIPDGTAIYILNGSAKDMPDGPASKRSPAIKAWRSGCGHCLLSLTLLGVRWLQGVPLPPAPPTPRCLMPVPAFPAPRCLTPVSLPPPTPASRCLTPMQVQPARPVLAWPARPTGLMWFAGPGLVCKCGRLD